MVKFTQNTQKNSKIQNFPILWHNWLINPISVIHNWKHIFMTNSTIYNTIGWKTNFESEIGELLIYNIKIWAHSTELPI